MTSERVVGFDGDECQWKRKPSPKATSERKDDVPIGRRETSVIAR